MSKYQCTHMLTIKMFHDWTVDTPLHRALVLLQIKHQSTWPGYTHHKLFMPNLSRPHTRQCTSAGLFFSFSYHAVGANVKTDGLKKAKEVYKWWVKDCLQVWLTEFGVAGGSWHCREGGFINDWKRVRESLLKRVLTSSQFDLAWASSQASKFKQQAPLWLFQV
jgi:hypothetical protein